MAKTSKRSLRLQSTTAAEWLAGVFGALLVLGAVAYLIYAEANSGATAPDVEIKLEATAPSTEGYVVEFKAHNRSSFSAEKVKIRGELHSSGGAVETSETVLDYLPAFSSRKAGLYFRHDPAHGTLELFPVSYANP